jgi:16S rRNA (uracil1498-N3)-methyltransferase
MIWLLFNYNEKRFYHSKSGTHSMPVPRFFCAAKLGPGACVILPQNAAHHATRVLRMKVGDVLILFNGNGNDYAGSLTRLGKDEVAAKITTCIEVQRESSLQITLAQAISSGERMDFTLQKAVELGIAHIQPLSTERSVVKLAGEKIERRREHWQNVVISACEQCGRAMVPEVRPPLPLTEWLGHREEYSFKIMLSPIADKTLHDLSKPEGPVCLLIGCEGGFSSQETVAAESQEYIPVRLGARVLRTETAALATLAALQTLWGDF